MTSLSAGAGRVCVSITLTAAALLLGGSDLSAVEPTFDGKGLTGLRVDGVNVLKQGPPHLQFAVLEQTFDGGGAKKYQFEKVAEPGKASFKADVKTFTEEFSWGTVEVAYKPAKDRLERLAKRLQIHPDIAVSLRPRWRSRADLDKLALN